MQEQFSLQATSKNCDSEDCTDSVKVFHARAAVTHNARSPIDEREVRGTISSDVDAERKSPTHSLTCCVLQRYVVSVAAALLLSRERLIASSSPLLPLCPSPSLLFDLMPPLP